MPMGSIVANQSKSIHDHSRNREAVVTSLFSAGTKKSHFPPRKESNQRFPALSANHPKRDQTTGQFAPRPWSEARLYFCQDYDRSCAGFSEADNERPLVGAGQAFDLIRYSFDPLIEIFPLVNEVPHDPAHTRR
jgi:hypothetical protein